MPYDTVVELPEAVRQALPAHAQEVWRKAFGDAWGAHPELSRMEREANCAKIAWDAVKRQYELGPKGGMKKRGTGKANAETQRAQRTAGKGEVGGRQRQRTWCFVNDLAKYPVQIIQIDNQSFVRGLPLMRPGTWNGNEYSADDMRQIASNFALVRDTEGFEPALKPQHSFLWDGTPIPTPASQVQGWSKEIWYDEAEQVLFGDLRMCDEWGALQDMRSGRLRYVSTEIQSDYELSDPTTGEVGQNIGLVLVGIAWVDNPAVKGLGWELVVNAAEYGKGFNAETQRTTQNAESAENGTVGGRQRREAGKATTRTTSAQTDRRTPSAKGGSRMSFWSKVKELLVGLGASEEDVAALGEPEVEANAEADATSRVPTGAEEIAKLRGELLERDRRIGELETKFATSAANARVEKITALVDARCIAGIVEPKARPSVLALAMALPDEAKVKIFAADGKSETEVSALEAYLASLDAQGPKVSTHARGLAWSGSEDPNAEDEAPEELLTAVAAQAG